MIVITETGCQSRANFSKSVLYNDAFVHNRSTVMVHAWLHYKGLQYLLKYNIDFSQKIIIHKILSKTILMPLCVINSTNTLSNGYLYCDPIVMEVPLTKIPTLSQFYFQGLLVYQILWITWVFFTTWVVAHMTRPLLQLMFVWEVLIWFIKFVFLDIAQSTIVAIQN